MADRHREGYQKDYYKEKEHYNLSLPKELGVKLNKIILAQGETKSSWFRKKAEEEIVKFEKRE